MSGSTWPVGDACLERRYRRLLVSYPRHFRRHHGAEIVTTLLEMAESGQTRPAAREAWHLLIDGVRLRFRLPADRPLARVGAVMVTLILAAFGGTAGAWAIARTFTGRLNADTVVALSKQVVPGGDIGVGSSGESWGIPRPTPVVFGVVDTPDWTPGPSRDWLAGDGWQVGAIRNPSAWGTADGTPSRHELKFDATRDGLHVLVTAFVSSGHTTVSVSLSPAGTTAMVPSVIAGILLGALLGWLLAAAGAYRIRRLPVLRRHLTVTLSALAITALTLPATALLINLARILHLSDSIVRILHYAVSANPYWSWATPQLLLLLTVAGLLLAIAAWATMGRHGPSSEALDRTSAAG